MPQVIIVVRETGRLKPEYSLPFELPEVPAVGAYISITRPDSKLHSEDLVVRKVWWRLHTPEEGLGTGEPKVGRLTEVMVECDAAVGPYSRDRWRDGLEAARSRGIEVETFEIERFSVRQDQLGENAP